MSETKKRETKNIKTPGPAGRERERERRTGRSDGVAGSGVDHCGDGPDRVFVFFKSKVNSDLQLARQKQGKGTRAGESRPPADGAFPMVEDV
jgi:hypothetical protein